ncbi:MAG: hypothetical protein VBE63_08780 [Lamprobacter sp.]|nr:hypothetical protein [Lamprobacter sp.]MEA3640024.1 hypothetical protein [Lamprobacter sp.]
MRSVVEVHWPIAEQGIAHMHMESAAFPLLKWWLPVLYGLRV